MGIYLLDQVRAFECNDGHEYPRAYPPVDISIIRTNLKHYACTSQLASTTLAMHLQVQDIRSLRTLLQFKMGIFPPSSTGH